MNLVITGCNGSVGTRVVLLALKRGHTVTGADNTDLSEELKGLVQPYQDRFTFHQEDLKDYDRTLELLQNSGCQGVVHLAAIRNPLDYKVQTHNKLVCSC
jgi:nucleoside-diphosphate-sugar epimerase